MGNKKQKASDGEVWIAIILFLICFASFSAGGGWYLLGLITMIPTVYFLDLVIFGKRW